jgi:acetyltransferase-like isoleucine patch superfamily enzyme
MFKRKPQYYLFKLFEKFYILFWHVLSYCQFKYWGVKIGSGTRLYGRFSIVNMNYIRIGNSSRINSGLRNFVGKSFKTALWTGQNGKIIIGDHVGISNSTIVSEDSVTIENHVFIGGGTQIFDNDFHPHSLKGRIDTPNEIPSRPIYISRGVFVGAFCIILKGVTIGENSIIGAGSLVTCNIPPNEIWAGVPAKKIKEINSKL